MSLKKILIAFRAMLHNPADFPDPETFNPDRFMLDGKINPDVPKPDAVFGFGRRYVSSILLAAFDAHIRVESVRGGISRETRSRSCSHLFFMSSTLSVFTKTMCSQNIRPALSRTLLAVFSRVSPAHADDCSTPESLPCRFKPRNLALIHSG